MQRVTLEEVSEKLEVYLDGLKTSGPLLITQDDQPVAVLMPLDEAGLAALRGREARPMADEERVEEDTWASGSEVAEDQEDDEAETGSTDEESMQTSARPHPHHQPTTGVREETE